MLRYIFSFCAGISLAGVAVAKPNYKIVEAGEPRLVVDLYDVADAPVSAGLFGRFSEHLGKNIYGGLWAELLENPGLDRFERIARRPVKWRAELKKRGRTDLLKAIGDKAPFRWSPYGGDAVSLNFTEKAPVSPPHASVVTVSGKAGGGIFQRVALPSHRCTDYELVLHLRAEGAKTPSVLVEVIDGSGKKMLSTVLSKPRSAWKQERLSFSVRLNRSEKPDRFDVRIGAAGAGTFAVDSVSLMPADNLEGWCPEAVQLIEESGCTLMRFPGGNFVSGYRWKQGIGDPYERSTVPNQAWDGQFEPNRVGSDEWMDFMRLAGCEPLLCINAGDGTAEEALQWLEYFNGDLTTPMGRLRAQNGHPEPYNIRFVEIGNELYGSWQVGRCDKEEYAQRYKKFYALLSQHYPNVHYIANGGMKHNPAWNEELLRVNGKNVKGISVHYLFDKLAASQVTPEAFYWLAMGQSFGLDKELDERQKQFHRHSPGAFMAVTELMLFPQQDGGTHPMSKHFSEALWYSGFMNACMRQGELVKIITYSASMNHGASLQKTDSRIYKTPGWLAYEFYATAEGRYPVGLKLASPFFTLPKGFAHSPVKRAPMLDAFALTSRDGKTLELFVANRDAEFGYTLPIEFNGGSFGSAVVQRISGEDIMEMNSSKQPNRIAVEASEIMLDNHMVLDLPKLSLFRVTLKK